MTTPPTNRPMTGEDNWIAATEIPSGAGDLIDIKYADGEILHRQERLGGYQGDDIIAYRVSRPAPEPERDGAVERVKLLARVFREEAGEKHGKARQDDLDSALALDTVLSLLETAERQRDDLVKTAQYAVERFSMWKAPTTAMEDALNNLRQALQSMGGGE